MNNNIPGSELVIRPASFNDIEFIQNIAYATWPVAYGDILPAAQLEYMLKLFYSTAALQKQMEANHHFYLALLSFSPIGFASFSHHQIDEYKLQKLYVLPGQQKTGAGRQLLHTVESAVQSLGGTALRLNVNRANPSLSFYNKHGFTIISEEDLDIGEGYFMNDFVMEKHYRAEHSH